MALKTVVIISESIATITSFAANFTLLYLIQKKTADELKPYSKILRQNCFVDMFFGLAIGLTFLQFDPDNGECIIFNTGVFRNIPQPYNGCLSLLFIFAMYFCLISMCIPFCYRYILVVKHHKLSNKLFYLLYVITGTLSLGTSIGLYLATWPSIDDENRKTFLHAINDFWLEDDGSYPIFLACHLDNLAFRLLALYAIILIGTAYFLITWFCIKTWKHLNQYKSQMSEKTRKLQKQLTYSLMAQALSPFIVAFLPLLLILLTIVLGLRFKGLSFMLTMVSWVAVLNPFCVIFFVEPYRDAILRKKPNSNIFLNQSPQLLYVVPHQTQRT